MTQLDSGRKVYTLDDDRIDFYWKDIENLLKEVPGFYDLYDSQWLYVQAKMGHLQVWALSDGKIEGIVLTQICVYPKAKVFHILAAAGNGMLKYFEEAEAMFEWLAADSGCDFIRASMRPGMARKLKHKGLIQSYNLTRRVQKQRAN